MLSTLITYVLSFQLGRSPRNTSQTSRSRYSLGLPKPTIGQIPDSAFQINLEEVRLESLDGKQIYDEVIEPAPTRRPRMSQQGRVDSFRQRIRERNDKKSATVRLAGYGEVPNCDVTYITQQIERSGVYTSARTCRAIFFTEVPGCGSGLLTELFSSLTRSRGQTESFFFMNELPDTKEGNQLDQEGRVRSIFSYFISGIPCHCQVKQLTIQCVIRFTSIN